jgi:RNA polymerase sigma factor (sigma-70 family)
MAASSMIEVILHLRRTVLLEGAGLTDGQLLGGFIEQRDDAAFAALVRRHGPMVWGLCRRLLNEHDAEDAFQATFLVLVRKAASIVPRERVANWLYGVAHQTALQARRNATRRRAREKQVTEMPEPAVAEQDLWRDLQPLLDQELSRLPDAYREVIVLADLEGKTRKEVARQLGLPEGTVGSRLARARTMLAKRLARHGLAVSGGALAAVLAPNVALAGVPDSVVSATIEAASLFAAGPATAAGAVSAKVAALAEGVVKTMFLTKLKIATTILVAIALASAIGGGSFTALQATPTDRSVPVRTGQNKEKATDKERPDLSQAQIRPELKTDKEKLQGTWKLVATHKHGKKVDPEDIPIHPHDLVIEGSKVETKLTKGGGDRGLLELNPAASPKQITVTWLIQWRGIYKLDEDKLTICFNPDNGIRPDGFSTSADSGRVLFVYERAKRRPNVKDQKTEKEGFTAWGKPVGGLQAGLGFRPGEHRAYRHGEVVTFSVRVRNTGKETVKFEYLKQFLDEDPPTVTDAEGKTIPQKQFPVSTLAPRHAPVEVTLEPGKELVLESVSGGASGVRYELRPAGGGGKPTTEVLPLFAGTGKVSVQYEHVFGNSSKGIIKLDPMLSTLATGKLELEIKPAPPAPPAAVPKETETPKEGFTAWGKEVGGLQAGLGFRPGEHRAYRHGEVVMVSVKVRNVGKKTVKFEYLRQFLDENPPTVTGADGPQVGLMVLGDHVPVEVSLEPGKEIELESRLAGAPALRYDLRPASGGEKPTTKEQPLFVGTGKVSLQYERVLGNSSAGTIKLDPTLSKLGTGTLEIEIKSDPPTPPAATKDKQVKSDEEQLQGTWNIISTVDGGVQLKEVGEWTFQDMKIKTTTQRNGLKLWGRIRFQINSRTKPKEIDMVTEGVGDDASLLNLASSGWEMDKRFFNEQRMQGIYSLEGYTLKLCVRDCPKWSRKTPLRSVLWAA